MNAMIAADIALAGVTSFVPFEEVVQAMGEVGNSLDESLRETGMGGLAGTKTGVRIRKKFLGKQFFVKQKEQDNIEWKSDRFFDRLVIQKEGYFAEEIL